MLEWIAAAFGVACVWLLVRRSLWNYPCALVSVSLLGVVFWRERLYSETLLQTIFFGINLYGWLNWKRVSERAGEVIVERMPPIEKVAALSAMIGLTLAWGAVMAAHSDADYPYTDATVLMLSVGAQIMLARRVIENWIVWIVVDLIAIPLYVAKGLTVTAGLYVIYLGLSVWGLRDWQRALHRADNGVSPA